MYVFEYLDRATSACPDAALVHHDGIELTYRQVRDESFLLAETLRNQDLGAGARVGVLMPNHPRFFTCFFGVQRTDSVMVLLNPKGTIAENMDTIIQFGLEFLFVHSTFEDLVSELQASLSRVRGVVCMDRHVPGAVAFEDWCASTDISGSRVLDRGPGWFDCAAIRTTGGSTGKPKGVMRPALGWSLMISDYLIRLDYRKVPVNLVITPLTHAGGEVALPVIALGGRQILLDSTRPRDILQAIQDHGITQLFLPPTLIYAILEVPDLADFDLSSLEYVFYGSAPISIDRLRTAREVFGPTLVQLYGLSEAQSTLAIMTPEDHESALGDHPERIASCGRAGPLFTIEIIGDDGNILAPGSIGEIACRGAAVMVGYADDPAATEEALKNGWLLSGDMGYKDKAGFVYIVDRKKDVIITGAINVFPGEVEQCIYHHPAIRECAVIGAPDDKWGEVVTAVVSLKYGQQTDAEELIRFCKERLGSIKAPKRVHFCDELPKSGVGKILRKDVRADFWKGRDRQI